MQYNTRPDNTIQYNTIQYNTIHDNTVQYSAIVNTVEITVESVVIQYSSNTLQYSSVVLHKVFFTYMFVISASFPVNQQEQWPEQESEQQQAQRLQNKPIETQL